MTNHQRLAQHPDPGADERPSAADSLSRRLTARLHWAGRLVSPWIQRWLTAHPPRRPLPAGVTVAGSGDDRRLLPGRVAAQAIDSSASARRLERLSQTVAQRFPAPRVDAWSRRPLAVDGPRLILAGEADPPAETEPDTRWLEQMPSFDEVRRRFEATRSQPANPPAPSASPAGIKPASPGQRPPTRPQPPGQPHRLCKATTGNQPICRNR